MSKQATRRIAFINIPYAKRYERIYLAFIAGIAGHGLRPAAAVHDPSSRYQLDRIYDLLAGAHFSFHDLSLMSVDRRARAPRLNMAFELGLAVAVARAAGSQHEWFVFDTVPHRIDRALSDLGGIRPRIHDFTPESVLRALMNALARQEHRPTLAGLLQIYGEVERVARRIKRKYSNDLFETRPFTELAVAASDAAIQFIPSLRG